MATVQDQAATKPQKTDIQPHRLGMGWHYVWRNDPPIEHVLRQEDGTPYYWRDDGETSEGCILYLADLFAMQMLGTTACEVYREAYRQRDGEVLDDEWLASDALRDAWALYTLIPKRWTAATVRRLFEDLEDVNYHSFLARLIELVEQRRPKLAAGLSGWCRSAFSISPRTSRRNTSPPQAEPANEPSWHHFLLQLIQG